MHERSEGAAHLFVRERARPIHLRDAAPHTPSDAEVARLPLHFFTEIDEPASLPADDALASVRERPRVKVQVAREIEDDLDRRSNERLDVNPRQRSAKEGT